MPPYVLGRDDARGQRGPHVHAEHGPDLRRVNSVLPQHHCASRTPFLCRLEDQLDGTPELGLVLLQDLGGAQPAAKERRESERGP